jgi:hypothetical protein
MAEKTLRPLVVNGADGPRVAVRASGGERLFDGASDRLQTSRRPKRSPLAYVISPLREQTWLAA